MADRPQGAALMFSGAPATGGIHTARLLPSPMRNRDCRSHFTDKEMEAYRG